MQTRNFLAAVIVSLGLSHFAVAQEFDKTISYANYNVVGFFDNTVVPGIPKGNIYFITSNPEMAVIFSSSASTNSMLHKIATGTLSHCWPLPDKNKQEMVGEMLQLRGQLPLIEAAARQAAAKEHKEFPKEMAEQLEQFKVQTKFFSLAGYGLPYFTCKQI